MTRKGQNLNNLLRGRVRASMNKFNLFNLYKKQSPKFANKTLYQQKWYSKMNTRGYHGEHLTERRWMRMFKPKLEAVAQLDASLKGEEIPTTPLTLQTYAPLEKRLETAVYRAMFASSVRQARQFILTGYVQVNGVTIRHPSFNLKPGDVFHVDPERVLYAMGRDKPSLEEAVKTDSKQIAVWNRYVKAAKANPKEVWDVKQSKPKSLDTLSNSTTQSKETISKYNETLLQELKDSQKNVTREKILLQIIETGNKIEGDKEAKHFESIAGGKNAAKCVQAFKLLDNAKSSILKDPTEKSCQEFISKKSNEVSESQHKLASNVKLILSELVKYKMEAIRISKSSQMIDEKSIGKALPFNSKFADKLKTHPSLKKEEVLEDESKAIVNLPWQKGLFGRQNPKMPYFTPWTPRPFIGCFAILPHHIEISFETCHAVYLRDPVARPDHSEVITPFSEDVHKRAYMYYVRKGL